MNFANPSGHVPRPAIDVRSLRVDYGDFIAVNDLSLSVPPGEVFGLVGPNGAGKTSTFRVLTTLMEPTYGDVFLDGIDIQEDIASARRIVGYMPDLAPVPSDMKVWEFLDFHAAAYGIGNKAQRRERLAECLEEVALTPQRDKWCKELSRGQTQRVVLAKTLLHRPRVLVLDEPASGLDPLARRDLRNALRRLAKNGATVFVSSHILSELAEMCTSICVMNLGKLLASGTVDEVRQQLGNTERTITAAVLGKAEDAASWLSSRHGVHELQVVGQEIVFGFKGTDDDQADLMEGLISNGVRLRAFEERRSSFEDILVEVAESNRRL
ncbi:ABC transporter ATP-binding protein [Luteolibacter luteus]|uniref:ABC transporter ATP-binding protein n=1 Tax=Luteolibacter luteus TaxID=2728835 RepID=A0A858RE46_9BACT|nr:ABC transporter ATP-binding protein [Luteolibacter luteus]QJE94881.1 ABC transporter ATP-binding protein [Luteolibacter luteus]